MGQKWSYTSTVTPEDIYDWRYNPDKIVLKDGYKIVDFRPPAKNDVYIWGFVLEDGNSLGMFGVMNHDYPNKPKFIVERS